MRISVAENNAIVQEIIDGDTVRLARAVRGARDVRLIGVRAPKPSPDMITETSEPWAEIARETLGTLALNRRFRLVFGDPIKDRYGRLLAHLHRDDGVWLQGELLKLGAVRVFTTAENTTHAAEMLALEQEARSNARGLWAKPHYRVREADDVFGDLGSFQLVEGVVRATATVRGRTYLNFGPNWRTDFTIAINKEDRPRFTNASLDPIHLKGKKVRVRGWVILRNGPMIEATHPEQIEIIQE